MDSKNFAIGILSVIGAILFTSLLIINVLLPQQQAAAFGQSAVAGSYVVTTSQLNDSTEMLTILHTPSQKMNFYVVNKDNSLLELVQPVDINMINRQFERRTMNRPDDQMPQGDQQQDKRTTPRSRSRSRRR